MCIRRLFSKQWLTLAPLIWAFSGPAAQAVESEDFLVQVWNTDEGLPHSTVTSTAQTPDGYLWVGTLLGGWRDLMASGS